MSGAVKAISSAVGSLFGGGPKAPKINAPETQILPQTDQEQARIAARKKLQSKAAAGRAGTIYSQSYGGTNLGGTA